MAHKKPTQSTFDEGQGRVAAFGQLGIKKPVMQGLLAAGYENPTQIQLEAIPPLLSGKDLIGCAETGSGKTAAFVVPLLQRLGLPEQRRMTGRDRRRRRSGRRVLRGLVIAPTRELAHQISGSLRSYGKHVDLRNAVVYGGVARKPQIQRLQKGVDILVATPGRLLDHVREKNVDLGGIEILVLDEADRMLDMGFIKDLRAIVSAVPAEKQMIMFSATMPAGIRGVAREWLRRPVEVAASPVGVPPEKIQQSAYLLERKRKTGSLVGLLASWGFPKTLVFCRTRAGTDKLNRELNRAGVTAVALHGEKAQSKRKKAVQSFESDNPPVLVATDVASRGLDFHGVQRVVNYDLPESPEDYVHRIGRTARAGHEGTAITFYDSQQAPRLKAIEKLMGRQIERLDCPDTSIVPQVQQSESRPRSGKTNPRAAGSGGKTSRSKRSKSRRRTPAKGRRKQGRQRRSK